MSTRKLRAFVPAAIAIAASCTGTGNEPVVPAHFEGIGSTDAPLLAGNCTIDNVGKKVTVAIAAGETLYATVRLTDGYETINAASTCAFPATYVVTATGAGASTHTVIIDYVNGLFSKGTNATTPGFIVDLSSGGTNTVKIRGSNGVDHYAIGAGTGGVAAFNANFGSTAGLDAFADVTLKGTISSVVISTGPGADVIDASGAQANGGVGAVYAAALKLYGGSENDTITGGTGADYISGGDGDDVIDGGDGNDTYYMGVAADGNDTINTASTTPGSDTVDYSGRTTALTINLNNLAGSGDQGATETDKLSDKIVTVLGGSGVDTITVVNTSTTSHVIKGGAGNDVITCNGTGNDTVDGQAGDDTMIGNNCTADYSGRVSVTVTVCNGMCNASNDDGDQTATYQVNAGTGVTAAATVDVNGDGSLLTSTLTGLSGMSANSVGRSVVIAGTAGSKNDGTFVVTAYNSATSVDVDVTASMTWHAQADAMATWIEEGAEKDNVQCQYVSGGTGADTLTGDSRNNILWGNGGADTLIGGAGDDSLYGGAGADILYGGAGADTLDGGSENDTLYGGDDVDVLTGGAGADAFTCNGKNDPVTNGTHPGDSDFTTDFLAGTDTGGLDCAF